MRRETKRKFENDLRRDAAILEAQEKLYAILRPFPDEKAARIVKAVIVLMGIDDFVLTR